jgi:UDP-N-acetylmuramoylalanine--D-glutamate ligase
MYIKRQKFLVLGLSKSGEAISEYLLKGGGQVFVYDDVESEKVRKIVEKLKALGGIALEQGTLMESVEKCDVLVLSPGVPIDHPLAVAFKRAKKAVVGETEIAARAFKGLAVAVTGTNGKTTTVSMIEKTLRDSGMDAIACGNIGAPMIGVLGKGEETVAVAEISSFQLETLNSFCPHVAVILNVTEDHLNRHYNMENYIFLKRKLLKNLTESEYAVLNYDDPTVRAFAEGVKAKVLWFSVRERVEGAYFNAGDLYYFDEKILSADEMLLSGVHNVHNALAAIVCAKILGVATENIANSLKTFKGIKHRVETVACVDGVAYVDDSKGTNVDATLKAVACMKRETVLLLGGKDKGYDYGLLFSGLKASKVVRAILYGENRYSLLSAARAKGFENVSLCPSFEEAVGLSRLLATDGQTVLLSPASASFDAFSGYEERGDRFCEIVGGFARLAKDEDPSVAPTEQYDE